MQAGLADLEAQLRSEAAQPAAGVLMVSIGPAGMKVRPKGSLLYYPEPAHLRDAPAAEFAEGEQTEFQRKDVSAAAHRYLRLGADP